MPKRVKRVAPPTPLLGRYRYVVLVPAGAGARLSFDGAVVELGNGWVDVTPRVAGAGDRWLSASLVGRRSDGGELLAEVLADTYGAAGEGALAREWSNPPAEPPMYWLFVGAAWLPAQRVDLPAPRPDVGRPEGVLIEHLPEHAPAG